MSDSRSRILFWTPRALALLLALFLAAFAADVFSENRGIWETVVALVMHLIPSAVVLLILAITWRREWLGGLTYLAVAIFYVVATGGRLHWSAYVVISGTLCAIAVFFFAGWWILPRRAH
jgi:hypothetical protein